MDKLVELSAYDIYKAVYEACYKANIAMPKADYEAVIHLKDEYPELGGVISQIEQNTFLASKNKRPLCQDTGQVWVYVQMGKRARLDEGDIKAIINKAVSDCYSENFFRKSVVKNALSERENTKDNTPAIIYADVVSGNKIRIDILIKGGGAENMSFVKMFNPSVSAHEIIDFLTAYIDKYGKNACPPLFLGIGMGGTLDYAAFLSKKAFFESSEREFASEIKEHINRNSSVKVADVSVLSSSTHIASLPVCVTINCHSSRHVSALVEANGYEILTEFVEPKGNDFGQSNLPEINVDNLKELRSLEIGEEFYLSGTIYTARDVAHQRLVTMLERGQELPFELNGSIIFYAGPCPKYDSEVIGPIGPTTAKRMDVFAPFLYDNGVFATIGKGHRSDEVKESIRKNKAVYLSVQGGVASLLQKCIKKAEVIAFEELGTEAVYRLEVEKFPVKLELK